MKNKLMKLLGIFTVIIAIFSFCIVYANDNSEIEVTEAEYSEAYKKWLKLDEEERKNTIQPRKYDIITNTDSTTYLKSMNNVFRTQQLLRASIPTQYNLKNIIPENVKVRNQMQTNSCWAFATLGVLESNLGMRDKTASLPTVAYDFSERHMNYASTRSAFLNNQTNEYGFSRALGDGGNFWMASAYLTNGLGAVDENSLPFENNEDNIDISEIQNKEVKTTLYDTKEFESVTAEEREKVMQSMKEHIVNYGGIYANVHGADLAGAKGYNNETGAMYSKDPETEAIDHAVVIIGWDDNYSKDNFNEEQKPSENGAWIVKNSWGENVTYTVSEAKQILFNADREGCEENGWYSAEQIPDDALLSSFQASYGENKVTIQGDNLVIEMGNDGYMYISYEDCNIYTSMAGIEKATYSKDYDSIYQNDVLGAGKSIKITSPGTISLANVFKKDSNLQEELDKVSIFSYEGYEYKVLVNPNGDSKNPDDLIEVKLKEGDTQTVEAGFHILEFAEPVRLTGESFVVVLQIVNAGDEKIVSLESKMDGTSWQYAIVNAGESYFTTQQGFTANTWEDLATWRTEDLQGNLCIKAYTNEVEEQDVELSEIYIDKEPTKTVYKEGENFDKEGMVIMARYSDGSSKEVTNYEITNGENLTADMTSVTIRYSEKGIIKTTTQEITVNKEDVVLSEIYIEVEPTKTEYQEGENFDKTGMKVIARYSDGSSKEITNYEVLDGENLIAGKKSVTISYTEGEVTKTTTQPITVDQNEVTLLEIYIEQSPDKIGYQEGENFDTTGMKVIARYSDGSSKEITNYEVIDGDNLTEGTTSVTISYSENGVSKTTTQQITVNQEEAEVTLTEIYIETEPTKTEYQEGENFDRAGMKVIARYSDGSSKEITNYEIIGGENLTVNITSVTIRYIEGGVIRSVSQEITVNEKSPEPSKKPVPSDFDNSKARITESKLYFNSSDLSNSTGEITIKVTGIVLGDESNTYSYAYYLSGTQENVNIETDEWKNVELTKENDGTYSMTISIKSDELSNYDELIESDNLYLYISEVATVDEDYENSVLSVHTLDVENSSEPQCYIDGEYVGGIDDVLNYNKNNGNSSNNNNNGDNTTASGMLPYAGRTILVIFVVLVISVSGVFAYHRYKNIDR